MQYCLGTVQFGMNYGVQNNGMPDEMSVHKILDAALANGISMFDTASAYGTAETVLGRYIESRNIKQEDIKIITKSKSCKNSNELIDTIADSIEKLKIDKLYGFLYHDEDAVYDDVSMESLSEIKNRNLSHKIGISVYHPTEAIEAVKRNVDIIQIPYNIFDHTWEQADFFQIAKSKNVEIYARSSLLQGLLVMDPDKLSQNMAFAKPYLEKFINMCKRYKKSQLECALGYVLSNKYIDYVVFGTDNMHQFKEYISLKKVELDSELIKEIDKEFLQVEPKLINPSLW